MNRRKSISSVKLPHDKITADMPSQIAPLPQEVLLPTTMHSGDPAVPVVAVGDYVRVGQLIAREDGRNSSPVHASVSGTVTALEPYAEDGKAGQAIRIACDGKMEKDPTLTPPEVHDLESFLAAVRASGVVGLGGAAFPTWAKLAAARHTKINTILINGAECEPYVTSDLRTMVEHSDYVVKGVELLRAYLGAENFVIGIEENKPEAIEKLKKAFENDPSVNIQVLACVYPQGAKQVILYNVSGLVVGEGERLASTGYLIINVTTLAKLAQFIQDGMPLVSRCVTVDGSAIAEPKNLVVPIGTSLRYLIEQAGGFSCTPGKVLYGGPMMGHTVRSLEHPVIKTTNGVLAFNEKESRVAQESPCIHCGRCVENCPMGLNPTAFARAMEMEDEGRRLALLEKEKVMRCIECSCCSYICPAHRPLIEYNLAAMKFVRRAHAAAKEGGAK